MNILERVKAMKLVSDIMANPAKYYEFVSFKITTQDAGTVAGTFVLTGPFAEIAKEFYVKGQMEKKATTTKAAGRIPGAGSTLGIIA